VPKQTTSETDEIHALRQRARELEAELEGLRRAHEAQARHLVAERLALANEIENEVKLLREEIDWRKEVMEVQEESLETLRNSRSLRYTEPLRRIASALRRS
jgi:hypothetical protein